MEGLNASTGMCIQHSRRKSYDRFPLLSVTLCNQSRVIARFLAHRHGLGGSDEWESAQIDAYVAFIHDAAEGWIKTYKGAYTV